MYITDSSDYDDIDDTILTKNKKIQTLIYSSEEESVSEILPNPLDSDEINSISTDYDSMDDFINDSEYISEYSESEPELCSSRLRVIETSESKFKFAKCSEYNK